jgi:hypothetical protein
MDYSEDRMDEDDTVGEDSRKDIVDGGKLITQVWVN